MKSKMFTLFSFVFIFVIATVGCQKGDSVSEELLTEEQKEAEKQEIIRTLEIYNEAAKEKNWSKMVSTLGDEVAFYGTDSGEVSKNFDEFKNTMQSQWKDYEVFEYGKMQDMFILLDDYARYASVIFGAPIYYGNKDAMDTLFVVYQRTLQKDPIEKKWEIVSGILAVPRANQ